MYRFALLGLSVLALSASLAAARTLDTGDFWSTGTFVEDMLVPSVPSGSTPTAVQAASARSQSAPPAAAAAPAASSPVASTSARLRKAALTAPAKQAPAAASKPAAPKASQPQATRQRQIDAVNSTVLPPIDRFITGSDVAGGMTRFSKDIRGLRLTLSPAPVLYVSTFVMGQPDPSLDGTVSAFTYSSQLSCIVPGINQRVDAGYCDFSGTTLSRDQTGVPAMTQVLCTMGEFAYQCDPQFRNGLTIPATGRVYVTSDPNTKQITSFTSQDDLLVDGVYTEGRPDTLLSSIIGFRRGSLKVLVQKDTTDPTKYSGNVIFNLFKGPTL